MDLPELFRAGLAYRKQAAVKWCPKDQTVLANEQVDADGHCERCGALVEVRQLEQWFLRITDYAERLLSDLDTVDWPEHVKTMQRNWIGRSEGAEVTFRCEELGIDYPVFTTRPDTLFGATFFVMAPEHPDVLRLVEGTEREGEVRAYVNHAIAESGEERGNTDKPKTGVGAGANRDQPGQRRADPDVRGRLRADGVRHGRDHGRAGARRARLCLRARDGPADPPRDRGHRRAGAGRRRASLQRRRPLVNSRRDFDGMGSGDALTAIVSWLDREGKGHASVSYRLRDWLISRQRYWGTPIPIVHCEGCGIVPVPQDQLPVELPEIEDYLPKGRSPLAAAESWVNTTCRTCSGPARRETDTMDTFVDSSWYFLRYCDARNEQAAWGARGR